MDLVQIERQQEVAILKLARGVTNAINFEMIAELSAALRAVQDDPEVSGLVLTSANQKFFSIGLDIPWLFPLSREDFTDFYKAFNRLCVDLFTLPKPTVAAVTGHATAGGCILVLCCDYRFLSEGRKLMGLNEIKLGVPIPYPADRIARHLLGDRIARDITETGDFYEGEKLLQLGMADGILGSEELLGAAIEKVRSLGADHPAAFARIKANRTGLVAEEIHARLDERERQFVELWYSPACRRRLKEAIEKF
jgi:enoyl-CoA hydratase/carnithine racemase